MKQKDNCATSNSKEVEMVDSTEESAHEMQMQAHSRNTSAMPTDNLAILPSDLQGEIARFLSIKEFMRLIMTSKEFFNDSKLIKTMIRKIKQPHAIKQLAAGFCRTLALTQDGRVLEWGRNSRGQLGLEHNEELNIPQCIPVLRNVTHLVAGARHTLGLTQDGRVWAWGLNNRGQLGLGHNNHQNSPQRIEGLYNVVQLVSRGWYKLALTQDGRVWAWGVNHSGQLGLGNNDNQNTPKQINVLKNVVRVAAGIDHALALTQDGRVFAWGSNHFGQLGLGHNNHQNTPKQINDLTNNDLKNVVQLVAGLVHTLAITHDGRVLAWGRNNSGQLGLGNNDDQNTPKQIKGLKNVVEVVTVYSQTFALTQDGRVWAWGYNGGGGLGLGHNDNQNTPQPIKDLENVVRVATGDEHTLALTQDGRVWAWGNNNYGQLGLGHHKYQYKPRQVNILPSSTQALLQYLEDHCSKISKNRGGKAVYRANGYDNADAKERSSSCSTAASSVALFSLGHQSRASVTQGPRSTEDNGPCCIIL